MNKDELYTYTIQQWKKEEQDWKEREEKMQAVIDAATSLVKSVREAEKLPKHMGLNMNMWLSKLEHSLEQLERGDSG